MNPNLYESNGLQFWTEEQIKLRDSIATMMAQTVIDNLKRQNRGFEMIRIEAPMLTPRDRINEGYTEDDVFMTANDLVLRPETTMGSYAAAQALLNPHNPRKVKPPVVVWQHGKSFRREQDQPTKFMRFKEFWQLEFQILFTENTAKDYAPELQEAVRKVLSFWVGPCRLEPSDRLPAYSEETMDVVREANGMEVCSISKRKDFPGLKVLEVAIGTDRVVLNHQLFLDESS